MVYGLSYWHDIKRVYTKGDLKVIITKEDMESLVKSLALNINGLKYEDVDPQTRINIAILSLESLKHNILNNIHKMKGE